MESVPGLTERLTLSVSEVVARSIKESTDGDGVADGSFVVVHLRLQPFLEDLVVVIMTQARDFLVPVWVFTHLRRRA